MKLPTTYKAILKLLITIAEKGNDYYDKRLSEREVLEIGALIAGIQNDLGEMSELLEKFNLKYNA